MEKYLIVALAFIIGTVLGSFIKAFSDRFIQSKTILGRSKCDYCHHHLSWYDLIPVLSFLSLLGRCRYCHKKMSPSYLLSELVLGAILALLAISLSPAQVTSILNPNISNLLTLLEILVKVLIIIVLAIIFLIDAKTYLIPDKIIFPASTALVLYLIGSNIAKSWIFYQDVIHSGLGKYLMPPYSNYFMDILIRLWTSVLITFGTGLGVAILFIFLIIITKGKGMGWGDVKYVFFLGLALGFPNTLVGLFLAFLTGAIFSLVLIFTGRKHFGQVIPFGPFLSFGAGIALVWGNQIVNWYLNYFRI